MEVRILPNLHTHTIKFNHFGSLSQDNEMIRKDMVDEERMKSRMNDSVC